MAHTPISIHLFGYGSSYPAAAAFGNVGETTSNKMWIPQLGRDEDAFSQSHNRAYGPG